jgi:tetratricopeptide (TPR) repeat protein
MKMVAYNMGVIHARLERYEEAIKFYHQETSKKDGYYHAYYNLGIIYKDIYQDYEQAKLYYLQGISQNKANYFCWYNLGCVYALIGNFSEATNCIYYAISGYPQIIKDIENDKDLCEYRKSEEYQRLLEWLKR